MGQCTKQDYIITIGTGLILFVFKFLFSDKIFDFLRRRSLITQIVIGIVFVLLIGFAIVYEIIESKEKEKTNKLRIKMLGPLPMSKGYMDHKSYYLLFIMFFLPILLLAFMSEYKNIILITVGSGIFIFTLTYDKYPSKKVEKITFEEYVCRVCGNKEIERKSMTETCCKKCLLISERMGFLFIGLIPSIFVISIFLIDTILRHDPLPILSIFSNTAFLGFSVIVFEIVSIFTFLGFYLDSNEHRRRFINSKNNRWIYLNKN
ncbi:MAG: hypothetical protein HeimC2_11640 [Candidatus Heimdallarchaeota archaeon LC_2]|nr:MAG: hypothetical protein HeimC2_11640 [Candidatus Heimdallarchaeota archaeon LC_2]